MARAALKSDAGQLRAAGRCRSAAARSSVVGTLVGVAVGVGVTVDAGVGVPATCGRGVGLAEGGRDAALMPKMAPPRPSSSTRVAMNATASGLHPRGLSEPSVGRVTELSVYRTHIDQSASTDANLRLARMAGVEVRCAPWHDADGCGPSPSPLSRPRPPPPPSSGWATAWASSPGSRRTGPAPPRAGPGQPVWRGRPGSRRRPSWSARWWASGPWPMSRVDDLPGSFARIGIALGATIGALAIIPLVGVPASRAQIVDNYAPHLLAGIYAAIGVLAGLVVALVAVAARAVAANVIVSAVWLWILAIIALVNGPAEGGPGFGQLAVWKFTDERPDVALVLHPRRPAHARGRAAHRRPGRLPGRGPQRAPARSRDLRGSRSGAGDRRLHPGQPAGPRGTGRSRSRPTPRPPS